MTQDETIALAKKAGLHIATDVNWMPIIGLEYAEKLIALARADEREACVELRNKLHAFDGKGRQEIIDVMSTALDEYQAAIRARGEQA